MICPLSIGQIIKDELRQQGHTNAWFAEQLGVNPRTINKIFAKHTIDTQQLLQICEVLKVDFFKHYSDIVCLE